MKDQVKAVIQKVWPDVKDSEDAAWGRLRRELKGVNRTQFHDAYLEVQEAKMTAVEKVGKDEKKQEPVVSGPSSVATNNGPLTTDNLPTNTPGGVVPEPQPPSQGEGSPTLPGALNEDAVEGLGSRLDHNDNENE